MLSSTLQLWLPNVEILIKIEEDRSSLQSLKTDRAANFVPFDKVLAQKVSKRNCCAAFCPTRQAVMFQPVIYTSNAHKLLAAMRGDTIACTEGVVEFGRDDHYEFAELSLVSLGYTKREVSLCHPGALHKAK